MLNGQAHGCEIVMVLWPARVCYQWIRGMSMQRSCTILMHHFDSLVRSLQENTWRACAVLSACALCSMDALQSSTANPPLLHFVGSK